MPTPDLRAGHGGERAASLQRSGVRPSWERTFAAQVVVDRRALADSTNPERWQRHISDLVGTKVTRLLREHGWTEEALRHPGAAPIALSVTDSHADFFVRNQIAVIAECRALDLRTADLLPPKMRLIGRSRRVP